MYLCLGTTQMISTPDPARNLTSRLDNARVIYGTADLRGWYGGDILGKLNREYPPEENMSGILRCNEGLLWGMILADTPVSEKKALWQDVADILVEFTYGSCHFWLGLYLGFVMNRDNDHPSAFLKWNDIPKMARDLLEALTVDIEPLLDFDSSSAIALFKKGVKDGLFRVGEEVDLDSITKADITEEEAGAMLIWICGVTGDTKFKTRGDIWEHCLLRMKQALQDVLSFDEGTDALPGKDEQATIGPRYIEWYCKFQHRLNNSILKDAHDANKVGHGIDGQNIYLLDCKYCPGFGEQVACGLTVWCYSPFFFWMSYIYARFATMINENSGTKPVVFHLECTELFNFTDFLQQNGVPTIDSPNYIKLASESTDKPIAFQRYCGREAPAAMLFQDGKWYRDSDVKLRTPDFDGGQYEKHARLVFPLDIPGLPGLEWDKCQKGLCKVGEKNLGFGKGQALYVASTEVTAEYVGCPREYLPDDMRGSVQYR